MHPSTDPVNALLSLGYAFLTNEIASLLEASGFDPFLGFLHSVKYGRLSLALDLIEEFRHPVIDGLVLTLLNKRIINFEDFYVKSDEALYLNQEAFSKFVKAYETGMERTFMYEKRACTFRSILKQQVELFQGVILHGGIYTPFLER